MASGGGPVSQQPQDIGIDPIVKFKNLLPRLKESLSNLMREAALVFNTNAQVDACVKSGSDSVQQRLNKNLEEFYAICDQIELNLRLAQECHALTTDSKKYTPFNVQGNKIDLPGQPSIENQTTYPAYLSIVRTQIACAQEIHDILLDCAHKITEPNITGVRQPPPAAAQPAQPQSAPTSMMTSGL